MNALRFFIVTTAVFLLALGAFLLHTIKRSDRILPRTIFGEIDLSGMDRGQARTAIRSALKEYLEKQIPIAAAGVAEKMTLDDIGVVFNEDTILDTLPFARRMPTFAAVVMSAAGQRVLPEVRISNADLLRVIDEKFPHITKAKNTQLHFEKKKLTIIPEQKGVRPRVDLLRAQLERNIAFLETQPLIVEFEDAQADITASDLEPYLSTIEKVFPPSLSLAYEQKSWEVPFQKNPLWLVFDKKNYPISENELPFVMSWDPVAFSQFVNAELRSTLEQAPEGVRIWTNAEGRVEFEGRGYDGKAVNREQLLLMANRALAQGEGKAEIPLEIVPPKIEISDDLQALGITELVSVGHTRFQGSPANRAHNIGVGVAKYNGLIIPPDTTFSFNENLGPVDASTGYKKELVIKPEGTIPEFGGGLCQVSSTLYRAAVFAGMPIADRTPHSYAVQYYAQVGGHGLDATVYPPSRDLKFINDTPGHILIQSFVDGPAAYFKFYGTKDERTVTMEGPFISNKRSASTEPVLIPDEKLAPGERKQVEKAHGGFDALWYRIITENGETKKEEIASKYRATANKFLVGGATEPPSQDSSVEANPFE